MRWRKLGRVFHVENLADWMKSHAANPVAEILDADRAKIYFSTRDALNRSSVAWVEVDLRDPTRVVRLASEPVLCPGERGAFDDNGCSVGCIVHENGKKLLYYLGWNLGVTVPWRNSIGLAVATGDGEFRRGGRAPIMDRSEEDPFTISYPWVLKEKDGWRMWYGSHMGWVTGSADMDHRIKSAVSGDGHHWARDGVPVIAPADASEYAFARPCVVRDADRYRMWYAFRGSAYRIGYAESGDGKHWVRRDAEAGIGPSPGEWDGDSVEYPSVFDHGGRRYMLYCGNGYGRTGFGIATLEDER